MQKLLSPLIALLLTTACVKKSLPGMVASSGSSGISDNSDAAGQPQQKGTDNDPVDSAYEGVPITGTKLITDVHIEIENGAIVARPVVSEGGSSVVFKRGNVSEATFRNVVNSYPTLNWSTEVTGTQSLKCSSTTQGQSEWDLSLKCDGTNPPMKVKFRLNARSGDVYEKTVIFKLDGYLTVSPYIPKDRVYRYAPSLQDLAVVETTCLIDPHLRTKDCALRAAHRFCTEKKGHGGGAVVRWHEGNPEVLCFDEESYSAKFDIGVFIGCTPITPLVWNPDYSPFFCNSLASRTCTIAAGNNPNQIGLIQVFGSTITTLCAPGYVFSVNTSQLPGTPYTPNGTGYNDLSWSELQWRSDTHCRNLGYLGGVLQEFDTNTSFANIKCAKNL